jgi:hypothetical protein
LLGLGVMEDLIECHTSILPRVALIERPTGVAKPVIFRGPYLLDSIPSRSIDPIEPLRDAHE